jgi:hypothetical protein
MFDLLHTELLSDEQMALGQQYAEQALRASERELQPIATRQK